MFIKSTLLKSCLEDCQIPPEDFRLLPKTVRRFSKIIRRLPKITGYFRRQANAIGRFARPSGFVEGLLATVSGNSIQDLCALYQRTLACDSVSPIAIFARALKATNGVVTRSLHMTVMFLASAFIHICNVGKIQTRYKRK